MKHLKKLAAFLAAVVMVITMSMPVMAATYTVASPSSKGMVTGHTYKAYQILSATSIDDAGTYGGLAWAKAADGTEVSDTAKTALQNAISATSTDVDDILIALGQTNDSTTAVAFAKAAYANKTGLVNATDVTPNTTVLGLGYWLIVDESDKDSVKAVNTANLFASNGTDIVSIVSKVDYPESTKKVEDINDSTDDDYSAWQDSADYDVNDHVPFRLTATIPSNYADYKDADGNGTYHFTFHDTQSAGLTFDGEDTIKVSVIKNGATAATAVTGKPYTVNGTKKTTADTFDIEFSADNLKTIGVAAGDTIVVEYTATLNESAVHGQKGNPNKSYISYNNDSNSEGDGTEHGKTPEDTVIVFTYDVETNKIKPDKTALAGADFTLYKEVKATTGATKGSDITFADGVLHAAIDADKYYVVVGAHTATADQTKFEFKGIDDGNYVLVETTVPAGYNAWESQGFTVTATHTTESDINFDNGKNAEGTSYILTHLEGGDLFTGDLGTVTLSDTSALLKTNIVNQAGSTLPSTGGMGTTILYVLGGLLVAGAVVVLVLKNKKNA